jgi:hypothetical protein
MSAKAQDDRSGLLNRLMSLGAKPANPPAAPPDAAQKRPRRGTYPIPAHRKNRRAYTTWLDEAAIRQFKQIALDTGVSQQDLMVEAINDLFVKSGKPPIAI